MSEKSGRPSKNDGRDRRMFASIQSSLGGRPKPRRQRENRETQFSYESLSDALNDLSKALESPSTSLLELESYLRERGDKFAAEECLQISTRLIEYTMKSGEFSFLLRICVGCINHTRLIEALANEFLVLAADYFTGEGNDQSVPELFGHVVASRWPPGKGRAIETVNPVLYVVMNVVMSWISVMTACGRQTKEKSLSSKMDEINLSEAEDEEEEKEKSEDGKQKDEEKRSEQSDEYDEKSLILSALAICTVCNVSQRNFWLNFMETFDEVFVATKNVLIFGDNRCSPRVRESLLQLYVSLFKWSATGQPKRSAVSTQT